MNRKKGVNIVEIGYRREGRRDITKIRKLKKLPSSKMGVKETTNLKKKKSKLQCVYEGSRFIWIYFCV